MNMVGYLKMLFRIPKKVSKNGLWQSVKNEKKTEKNKNAKKKQKDDKFF